MNEKLEFKWVILAMMVMVIGIYLIHLSQVQPPYQGNVFISFDVNQIPDDVVIHEANLTIIINDVNETSPSAGEKTK